MRITNSLVTALTAVFDAIFTWLASAIEVIIGIFWSSEGGLTFMGVLALIGLAISIFFLLVGVISNFLHLRG